jgi:hypothetical protein
VARISFILGFYASEFSPFPTRLLILRPRGTFAHPNSDGIGVCIGEQLPPLIPADVLLLHAYRILTYQKFNLRSALRDSEDVVKYVTAQPPDTFPTDRTPLF